MIFQLLIFASLSFAQSSADGVLIRNADSMYSDRGKQIVQLDGHVQIVFQGQSLSCDRATIDMKSQILMAEGHVISEGLKIHFEGSRIRFNYKTNTGMIYNGFVQSGQSIFQGDTIEKTGDNTYIATNAEYTSCETCPPGWAFSGRTIEAELGGYAYIKRPIFKVGGVPIFIFPAMMVPLKSTRQSGFLVPGMDYSSGSGLDVMDSFFWAIDKSQDLTATAMYYEKRGLKGHEEYRFVLDPQSKGELQSAFISDRVIKTQYTSQGGSFDRWFVHYKHYFDMPDDFVSRADIKPASDVRYVQDFPLELQGSGDPSLESTVSITKNWEQTHFGVAGVYNQGLLKHFDPGNNNADAVHKLPEIDFSSTEHRLFGPGSPLVKWDVNYANFTRNTFSYDPLVKDGNHLDANGNPYLAGNVDPVTGNPIWTGTFDPSIDKLRTGQRLDIQPSISYPFQVGHVFDIVPRLSYRETDYQFNLPSGAEGSYSPNDYRRYLQADLNTKTEFSTIYGNFADEKGTRWKHSFQPELSYSGIPWIRNPTNTLFFGNTSGLPYYRQWYPMGDSDVSGKNGLQFDYEDRTYSRQLTNLSLTNTLVRKTFKNGDPFYERVALFRISQAYDFAQQGTTINQPWSPIETLLNIKQKNFETFTTAEFNNYANRTNVASSVKALLDAKNYLLFSYTLTWLFDETNVVVPNSKAEDYGVGLGYTSRYFDVGGLVDYSTTVRPNRWSLQSFDAFLTLRPPGNCWHLRFSGHQDLGGQTSVRINFAFDFSGGQGDTTNSTNSTQI